MGKIGKTTVCKTWDIRKQRKVISESWERNKISLEITPACSHAKVPWFV